MTKLNMANCVAVSILLFDVFFHVSAAVPEKHPQLQFELQLEPLIEEVAKADMALDERRGVAPQRVRTLIPPNGHPHPGAPISSPSPSTPGTVDEYGCRKVSPCVCQTRDGSQVDLTPLANTNNVPRFLDVPDSANRYRYSWNPCNGFNEGSCQNVAICQTFDSDNSNSTDTDSAQARPQKGLSQVTTNYDLGHQDSVDFDISSQRGLMMVFTGPGGPSIAMRTSYIQLHCDPTVEAEFTVEGEVQPTPSGVYYFTLRSRHACLSFPTPPTTPISPPTAVTVTSHHISPSPGPYNLETVVDLLFVLTVVAAVGVVVLILVLTVVCIKSGKMASGWGSAARLGVASMWPISAPHAAGEVVDVKDKTRLLP